MDSPALDYRIAFDQAPVGLVLSRHRLMIDCNRELLAMFGARREQIVGRFWYEMPLEWHETLESCPAMEAMAAGERIETERSTPDGRVWFIQAAPLRDKNGDVMGGVEIATDITRYRPAGEVVEELSQESRQETPVRVDDPPARSS